MQICLWKRTVPFHSTTVTCHNLTLLLWSPWQRCLLPSAIVPLQLFGDHTENQIQADFWARKSLFLWGSAPAAVPAQLRRRAAMEQQLPRALLPWKGPVSIWAVPFAFQLGKQRVFWIESYMFLLTPLQQSAMCRSLRPLLWLSAGWEITLQEVAFRFYALSSFSLCRA